MRSGCALSGFAVFLDRLVYFSCFGWVALLDVAHGVSTLLHPPFKKDLAERVCRRVRP